MIVASFINQWYFTFCLCEWSFIRNSAEISYLKYDFRTLLNECSSIQGGLTIMHEVDKRINLDLSKANIVFKFILVRLSITRVRISFSCSLSWWNVTYFFCIVFWYIKKTNVFLWLLSTRLFCGNINYTWSHINYGSSSGLIGFDQIPTRIYVPIYNNK